VVLAMVMIVFPLMLVLFVTVNEGSRGDDGAIKVFCIRLSWCWS